MNTPLIDIIAGARPNFMKVAPIIHALQASGSGLRYRLIHTGQHYDARMSDTFFRQLNIPDPDINLGVGSGSQATQTAKIMMSYEEVLLKERSQCCLVVGDVNSTVACALTAQKLGIPVAHVEGGLRSGDWSMPEEINRLATDAISNWFFTTSHNANATLAREGVSENRIFFVGNTMIDTLLANMEQLAPPDFWAEQGLAPDNYLLLTLHRPANVDDAAPFRALLEAVAETAADMRIVYPAHPRTIATLEGFGDLANRLIVVEPQPYHQFNYLAKHALGVITDSGGITEETTVMGVPCLTLRDNTERPETVSEGTNILVGTKPTALRKALAELLGGVRKTGKVPDLWDGQAGQRIAAKLRELLCR
ncbi:non-hydrolyzing UDP-N-acetylglucosamine 2-epimerase [Pontivivens insulae]|uniref:UDP-2,3-diacetamido-2,3-dideoxy-D-glucuronate 2-epimerase n=1 Tax=Pontivivens insulae TaxID=1639689 RepID=A0A2R8A7I4_9RHOB|nr:UDP-N-acetylglucosamine 2-epimerase (non-hydrolyzing) [Pontivivens insulae]RED18264.1 UDP-N-acetylglucosamine 2-epimerase (non-hydrolysing) [Pontivivens insulae]SPF28162.1 UDP-2,3-diacetamido-2,3-dideoxy-D-glucuronate 2-epimerase [Pontivivens insulae]